ncbi:MAG: hypothetical protein KJ938_01685 [Actinobacteria bacterium]|nr:hypothetical protein [Actinomycetota bacterium]
MSVDLRTAPSASTLPAPPPSAPGAMCTASGPAAFSIASDGSPAVPRLAVTWVRGTALPATVRAREQVQQALDRAADSFQGISGTAYAFHASIMLRHLGVLADGLTRAAALFESYAERLVAHERLLSGVRAQAVASGFSVTGDLVGAPDGPADSGDWSTMAAEVAAERQALRAWVATHLDAALADFLDEETFEWVGRFFGAHHSTLVSGVLGTALKKSHVSRVGDIDRGGVRLSARELDRLADAADRLSTAGDALGPITVAYDTVSALESDEPGLGMARVSGGVVAAGLVLTLPISSVVISGAVTVVVTMAAVEGVERVWGELPDDWTDTLDESIGDGWGDLKDATGDVAGKVLSWVS